MTDSELFWKRYLPIEEKIKNGFFSLKVANAFDNLFNGLFRNTFQHHPLSKLPRRLKLEMINLLKYYPKPSDDFLEDLYFYHKNIIEILGLNGYSFNNFKNMVAMKNFNEPSNFRQMEEHFERLEEAIF